MEDKENMARPFRPGPESSGQWRRSTGLAERRMEALREQQRQERLANPDPLPRAATSEVCMDVEMVDCSDLRSIEEEMDCSTDDDILPSTNDVKQRENLTNLAEKFYHSNFAENLDQHTQYDFYVVDTCVYIDALEGVKALLKYCQENHSVLVVPYQVLQELDFLKIKRPELRAKLEASSRFILQNLERKNRAFRAQHTLDFKRRKTEFQVGDDRILECALQVLEQVPNVGAVTMVTHDTILRAKAIAAKLGESTMNRLLASLSN